MLARLERPHTNPAKTPDQETAGSIPAEISANGARVVVWSTTPQKNRVCLPNVRQKQTAILTPKAAGSIPARAPSKL